MFEQNRMREIGGDTSLYSYSLDICLSLRSLDCALHSGRNRVKAQIKQIPHLLLFFSGSGG